MLAGVASLRPDDDTLAGPAAPPRIDASVATRISDISFLQDRDPAAEHDPVPARIGRFLVLKVVGSGGMGQVFAAYDPKLDRHVALKLVPRADGSGEWQDRLVREAQAMARLSHPNVVTVHEVDTTADGQLHVVMELVEGQDLARHLAAEPRPWRDVLALFRAAGEGLAAAHAAGLVHRDFKPANVLVGVDGRVRVADFGLAHGRNSAESYSAGPPSLALSNYVTRFGAVIGTPAYMAPEQHDGGVTDARSDIFAFCVALWEALYGVRPFAGSTMTERLQAIRRGELRTSATDHKPTDQPTDQKTTAAKTTTPKATEWLRPILRAGLASDPADRWQSMRPLLDALDRDPEAERARRRRTLLRLLAVLALGGALVYAASALWSLARERAREAAATRHLDEALVRLESLYAVDRTREADALFDAFLAAPEHQGTRAVVRALRWRATRRHAAGDVDAALDEYSQAYAAAHHPGDVAAVLLDLADLFHERRAWAPLGWVLANLSARAPDLHDRTAPLALDAAAYRRDLTRAAELAPALAASLTSLARAAPSDQTARRGALVDLEGDGTAEVVLWDSISSSPRVVVARAVAGLPTVTTLNLAARGLQLDRALPGPPGAPAWLFASDGTGARASLFTWRSGQLTQEATWATYAARGALAADLDRDGHDELYAAIGPYGRRIIGLRRVDDAWQQFTPTPDIDAIGSDVYSLAAADLDGDGGPELVAGLGPWGAYDVRVLKPGAPGRPFEPVARRKLGMTESVAILQGPDGPLIAATKNPESLYAAPAMFPDGDHTGAAPGVYLLRLQGRQLTEVAHAPVAPDAQVRAVTVADLDGDGAPELLGDLVQLGQHERMLALFRRDAPRPSTTTTIPEIPHLRLGHVALLAAGNLDDDPADELIVADSADDFRVWTLGLGDDALPLLDLGHPATATPPPPGLETDALLRDAWAHASELAGLGLLSAAGRRFADLARTLPPGPARGLALAQAGTLAADAGELDVAAARLEDAARNTADPELRSRAADSYERMGRLDDAIRVLAEGDPRDPATRARIDRHDALLASERTHTFDRPLGPAWHLLDPLALTHDPLRGVLTADLMGPDPVLALPVDASQDHVVRVTLSLAEIGWGGSLTLRLRPDDPTLPATTVVVYRSGSSQGTDAQLFFAILPRDPTLPLAVPHAAQRLTLELSHLATLGEQRLTVRLDDHLVGETLQKHPPALAGPATLELLTGEPHGGRPADDEPWTRVDLHRIVTRGLAVRDAPPAPHPGIRRALVDAHGDALALLEPLAPEHRPPLWSALAAQQAGDLPRAVAELRRDLALDPTPTGPRHLLATRLLRARGEVFAPLLREALGDAYLDLFHATWSDAAGRDQTAEPLVRALLGQLPPLPTGPLPPRRAEQVADLRSARAAALALLRYTDAAHAELALVDEAAIALSDHAERIFRALLLQLAALDLEQGRIDHAFLHLEQLRRYMHPELHADILRADPALAPLHADPRWRTLVGD